MRKFKQTAHEEIDRLPSAVETSASSHSSTSSTLPSKPELGYSNAYHSPVDDLLLVGRVIVVVTSLLVPRAFSRASSPCCSHLDHVLSSTLVMLLKARGRWATSVRARARRSKPPAFANREPCKQKQKHVLRCLVRFIVLSMDVSHALVQLFQVLCFKHSLHCESL